LFELSFRLELTLDSPFVAAARPPQTRALQAALQEVTLSAFHEERHGSR
jgi:hypothetical protein